MPNLLVRGVDDELVQNLREQAAAHGRSSEAEHREILSHALKRVKRKSLAEVLMAMPNVGEDADFERVADSPKAANVFG
ncbi:DNA-binding protein [Trinickia terrae]|uniref:DNA-binding protein n=1 Tax=Trinickia terrae TaxID=2571161 RepID=A0A4U1HUN7_9BURK|nr:DNA-binding protein [Trinickia terrae]TKC82606.1 DNA-binding protein [Trinickia terrae]